MSTYTPPATRIKIVTALDKTQRFTPQFKGWFFWHAFEEYTYCGAYDVVYNNIEDAQKEIDKHLASDKAAYDKKTKSIEYVKYP